MRIEFLLRRKQFRSASAADVFARALLLELLVGRTKGALGARMSEYLILFRRENLPPFLVGLRDFGNSGPGGFDFRFHGIRAFLRGWLATGLKSNHAGKQR